MMTGGGAVESEKIWDEFKQLPYEAQCQVKDFIAFLRKRNQIRAAGQPAPLGPVSTEPFVGIWRNRDDMKDSGEWVSKLRQHEWNNNIA